MKDTEILRIVLKMKYCSCDKGKFVIKQGDVGSLFFILCKSYFGFVLILKKREKWRYGLMENQIKPLDLVFQ